MNANGIRSQVDHASSRSSRIIQIHSDNDQTPISKRKITQAHGQLDSTPDKKPKFSQAQSARSALPIRSSQPNSATSTSTTNAKSKIEHRGQQPQAKIRQKVIRPKKRRMQRAEAAYWLEKGMRELTVPKTIPFPEGTTEDSPTVAEVNPQPATLQTRLESFDLL